ncbi:MAG: lysozyme inhibitor LprI family protein [Hyphomicrobium sp.]|jgi:uncharacterized protein YecT (DUF1311 family)
MLIATPKAALRPVTRPGAAPLLITKSRATFLLVASTLMLSAAPAEADPPPVDCNDIKNTYDGNICAERDFDKADAKLNNIYKKVLEHTAKSGDEKPWDAKSWEAAIRASQRAWVAFRDADCKDAVPMEWSGGTGTTVAVLGCMTEKTKQRTDDLAERYGIE